MTTFQLIRRATILFPRTPYSCDSWVRHARKEWVRKQMYLAARGIYILDQPVERLH